MPPMLTKTKMGFTWPDIRATLRGNINSLETHPYYRNEWSLAIDLRIFYRLWLAFVGLAYKTLHPKCKLKSKFFYYFVQVLFSR
ncbi:MAG: hypothetical protein SFX18_05750 [Pirellulales bacterium]|nr:hypothetical protein [Pirellulales bacterium]